MNNFETIWQSIYHCYFDRDFSGVDWEGLYEEYGPILSDLEEGPAFYDQANKMLFELNASNPIVVPQEHEIFLGPKVLSEGGIGIDAVAQILTANNTILEGKGVLPDIDVPLGRQDVIDGIDPPLDAALAYLQMNHPEYASLKPQETPYLI